MVQKKTHKGYPAAPLASRECFYKIIYITKSITIFNGKVLAMEFALAQLLHMRALNLDRVCTFCHAIHFKKAFASKTAIKFSNGFETVILQMEPRGASVAAKLVDQTRPVQFT